MLAAAVTVRLAGQNAGPAGTHFVFSAALRARGFRPNPGGSNRKGDFGQCQKGTSQNRPSISPRSDQASKRIELPIFHRVHSSDS